MDIEANFIRLTTGNLGLKGETYWVARIKLLKGKGSKSNHPIPPWISETIRLIKV